MLIWCSFAYRNVIGSSILWHKNTCIFVSIWTFFLIHTPNREPICDAVFLFESTCVKAWTPSRMFYMIRSKFNNRISLFFFFFFLGHDDASQINTEILDKAHLGFVILIRSCTFCWGLAGKEWSILYEEKERGKKRKANDTWWKSQYLW